jgi:hypothetical protein
MELSAWVRCKLQRLLAVVVFLALLVGLLYLVPMYEQVCTKNEFTYARECTGKHVVTLWFQRAGSWLSSSSVVVSAIAAAASAFVASTVLLINRKQSVHARASDRAYVSGGGDVVDRDGKQFFRFDVENHGKTPAFTVAYDVHFAKLAELQKEFPKARDVCRNHPHVDGVSPTGARKKIFTEIERKDVNDDVVFGAVWYEDVWGDPHFSRFILRIAEKRNIEGEGLTRLDVRGVSKDYSSWDYPKRNAP